MKSNLNLALLVLGILGAQTGFAAESTSSTNSSSIKAAEAQKKDEKTKDIDDEITDARMRATLGSKSKFSFKSSLTYSGSSIETPLAKIRPNYRASATIPALTSLSGDVGVNFRATSKDFISFGTGVSIVTPLHGDLTKDAEDDRFGRVVDRKRYEASTPFISWNRGYKVAGTQMSSTVTYSHATDSDSVDKEKFFGSLSFSQVFLANFGTTKWNGGLSATLGYNIYSGAITDTDILASMARGSYKRSEYSYGLFPFLQYTFNDTLSFRTVFGYAQFTQYVDDKAPVHLEPYQSIGLGVSITRDIYLYPNVQFTARDIRSDRTNVGLTANLNLF